MKKYLTALLPLALCAAVYGADKNEFGRVPVSWKWISEKEAAFTYDGTYTDSLAFSVNAKTGKRKDGIIAPEKYAEFPLNPEGAVNMTYSPDSTKIAYTRDNDLYVADIATGEEKRLTYDGTDLILNGYASWVYYEEILGRASKYKAFWWSPDSRRIGFYRFDNTSVPLFPIYSPFGQDGKLNNTRYPKAGEKNPEVRIGIAEVSFGQESDPSEIVWADFEEGRDGYFGIPFWGADSREFYVSTMPRLQNTLDLYAVGAEDGRLRHVYHEEYKTWIDWLDGVVFTESGLYMARRFETGWEQIYFLSYDGKTFRRLTDGQNWGISILRADEKNGDLFFTARRDSRVRETLYRLRLPETGVADAEPCMATALTDPAYDIRNVRFSPSGKYFAASYSNSRTPVKVAVFDTDRMETVMTDPAAEGIQVFRQDRPYPEICPAEPFAVRVCRSKVVADMAYKGYSASDYPLARLIWLEVADGFSVPAAVVYPANFDRTKKYPVHIDIYGGPDSPLVRDRWRTPSESTSWWSDNGIIQVTADCRAAGHNGRAGTDLVYRNLTEVPVRDFIAWAEYFQSLPYVNPDKIGVEGFSFGGTMTTMLLCRAPEQFHYGIAGGGVYDWALYDSHYTERYMETPQSNSEGYKSACTLEYVSSYPTSFADGKSVSSGAAEQVMLKLTHGTGDDNVHFQNTLQLIDALQKEGKKFEFMIYPDGMHGYRGYQKDHFDAGNREFWLRYLCGE